MVNLRAEDTAYIRARCIRIEIKGVETDFQNVRGNVFVSRVNDASAWLMRRNSAVWRFSYPVSIYFFSPFKRI